VSMKFGIVVCSKCKKAKVVDLSCKTTRCPRCGKILMLDNRVVLYKTDSLEKLRKILGVVNAQLDGKLDDFKRLLESD
jgi:PHP family Zn ribbon phosphoesterase